MIVQFYEKKFNVILDGAPCHGDREALEILKSIFGTNIIHLKAELPHPASSPDLSLCDGSVWPFLRLVITY